MPAFSGPYSSELAEAWKKSDSTWVREVLADGQISDQEYQELGVRLTECYAESGIKFTGFTDDGLGYSLGPSQMSSTEKDKVGEACDESTGQRWIQVLRVSMATNPDNTPVEEAMTQCLIRNGAVAADYTKEQYLKDAPDGTFPYLTPSGSEVFRACNSDPSYSAMSR